MRTRSFAALAAVSVLMFAACGDDDEDAGGDSTIAGLAPAATEPAAAAVETTAGLAPAATEPAAAAVETTAAAVGVETSAAVVGVETSGAPEGTLEAAAVETSAAAVGVATSAAPEGTLEAAAVGSTAVVETAAAVETSAVAGGVETSAAPEGTLEATAVGSTAVVETAAAVETTAAVETSAVVETSAAPEGTLEAAAVAVDSTEAAGAAESTEPAGTTEAGAETTAAATETSATPESSTPGSVPATSAPGGSIPAGEPGAITVGSANFPESELLAQIYGQALAAAGFDVSYELGIGSREAYLGAIESGEIGLIPEYTGSLLAEVADDPSAANVDEQLDALGESLPEGLEVLTPSSAEDKDTIVCTEAVVEEFGLTDLSSLFENSDNITLGAPPEFEERSPFGLAGFSEEFDAEFAEFIPLAPGDIPAALSADEIDCGNIFSTDPAIDTGGFVALEDDLVIVPNEAVLPLVRSELVTPELSAALDEVNAALDTETLTALLAQVVNDQLGADVVAAEFLASLGE